MQNATIVPLRPSEPAVHPATHPIVLILISSLLELAPFLWGERDVTRADSVADGT